MSPKKSLALNLLFSKMLLVHFFKIFEATTIVNAGTLYFLQVDNFEGRRSGTQSA